MPQLITHHIFGMDVLKKLNNSITKNFDAEKDIYEMFCQSFDNFLYYMNFNPFKCKKVRFISKKGHRSNVKKYFVNIINNIKKLGLENDEQALAYLYGSINHYVLDSTCHPFIFYKTGYYNKKKKKETKKYIGLHGDMESNIDAFFYINRYKKSYHKVNVTKEFIPKVKFTNNLKLIMDETFINTFNEKNASKYYINSYNSSRILYRLFINDKFGLKKFIFKIHDKINIFKPNKFQYYTTYIKQPNLKYLNIEHKKWCYPSDKTIVSNESFIDLYNKAIDRSVNLITLAHDVINNKKDIKEFKKEIGNLSYTRGLDCDNSKPLKYYEF